MVTYPRLAISAQRFRPKLGHDVSLIQSTVSREQHLAPTSRDPRLKHNLNFACHAGMVVAKQLAALVIEDVPGDVQIQIDRQEFVEKKLIFCAADDQMEVPGVAEDGDAPDVTIFDKDDSVVYLDYPGYENYGKERKREISDSVRSRKKVMEDAGYIREAELTSL